MRSPLVGRSVIGPSDLLTMPIQSDDVSNGTTQRTSTDAIHTELDDSTEHTSGNTSKNDPETTKFRLRFTFDTPDRHLVPVLHRKLAVLMEQLSLPALDFFDKSDKQLVQSSDVFWDSFESYSKFFRVHEKSLPKNKVHHIVIATIRSSLTTAGFKRNKDFLTFLKKHKMYVDTHHFSSKDWDISNPGWFEGLNTTHVTLHTAKHNIRTMLQTKVSTRELPHYVIQKSRIAFGTQSTPRLATYAYAIQVKAQDIKVMTEILRSIDWTKTSFVYVPYAYKYKNEKIYKRMLQAQIALHENTWVIKLGGINEETMKHLEPRLKTKIPSLEIQSHSQVHQWKLLISKDLFTSAHALLSNQWNTLLAEIPDHIYSQASTTTPAVILSRSPGQVSDNTSTSTVDTYLTMLTRAFENSSPSDSLADDSSVNSFGASSWASIAKKNLKDVPAQVTQAAGTTAPSTVTESTSPPSSDHSVALLIQKFDEQALLLNSYQHMIKTLVDQNEALQKAVQRITQFSSDGSTSTLTSPSKARPAQLTPLTPPAKKQKDNTHESNHDDMEVQSEAPTQHNVHA